jgi:molybdopterin-guanine dinucleotide biosynthesis protein
LEISATVLWLLLVNGAMAIFARRETMEREHLEVLLESMDKKFDIVIEGYSTLNGKIDNLARRTDERFDLVDLKFEAMSKRIDDVEQSLSVRIDSVEAKLKEVGTDLKEHRADTEAHQDIYRVRE